MRTNIGDNIFSGQLVAGSMQLSSAATVTVDKSNAYVGLQAVTSQTANLPLGSTCLLGTEKVIDDLGGNSGTNAHTIAAFAGNTISTALGVAATMTLDQNGGTVKLKLITATQWRVIG